MSYGYPISMPMKWWQPIALAAAALLAVVLLCAASGYFGLWQWAF